MQGVQDTPHQSFREAYLSAKLGRAYEDGQPWAGTDMNGVQLSKAVCDHNKVKYANVRILEQYHAGMMIEDPLYLLRSLAIKFVPSTCPDFVVSIIRGPDHKS